MKTAEIQSVIEQLEQQEDVNVDEAVTGSNVVYNQSVPIFSILFRLVWTLLWIFLYFSGYFICMLRRMP